MLRLLEVIFVANRFCVMCKPILKCSLGSLARLSTLSYMVSHWGHNCIFSTLTILDSALTS